ncbi:hypothetical protein ACH4KN_21140 [Streptomyces sp. NPDC017546]|uniref:hypothetical protein n=1 Tax=unclassified Streptomyces TaxID=2593676 RepID=UPI002361689F|nr:hypothetical protein [Streptomyces sp. MMBL 11-1]
MTMTMARRAALAITALALTGTTLTGLAPSAQAASMEVCVLHNLGGARYYCEYGVSWVNYPNGDDQAIVVGTDYAVWTSWGKPGNFGGWKSMGGNVRSAVYVTNNNTENPRLTAAGTDNRWWYTQRRNNGSWSPWTT